MSEDYPPEGTQSKTGWLNKISNFLSDENEIENLDQLRQTIEFASNHQVIKKDTADMIDGVLDISLTQVADVMVPRGQMVVLKENWTVERVIELIMETGHSRYPVISEDYEQVIGIIIAKDLLPYVSRRQFDIKIQDIMRKTEVVPESKRLDSLLRDFRLNRQHMAVVIDEYGNLSGLVTIEDILEEIVGEIDDEHDEVEDAPIRKQSEGQYIVNALTMIEDFNDFFQTDISDEDVDTIGGFLLLSLGRMPQVGEQLEFSGLSFRILKADQRRIISLLVKTKV